MAKVVKKYAQNWVQELRSEIVDSAQRTDPALDFAQVIAKKPQITIQVFSSGAELTEDEIAWNVDPHNIKKNDIVTIGRDPSGEVVVIGVADGNDPDPTEHPEGRRLKVQLAKLKEEAKTWKPPVVLPTQLPKLGNGHGDIRLVISQHKLYYWNAKAGVSGLWLSIAGTGGGGGVETLDELLDVAITAPQDGDYIGYDAGSGLFVNLPFPTVTTDDPTKLPLTGGTLTGPLVMTTGTDITLPDAPVDPTDAVNKLYVDNAIAAALGTVIMPIVLIPTIVISANYVATTSDQVFLVNATGGPVTVTLPDVHIAGRVYELKDMFGVAPGTAITFQPSGGDTIDGNPSVTLTIPYQSLSICSDGTNWFIL